MYHKGILYVVKTSKQYLLLRSKYNGLHHYFDFALYQIIFNVHFNIKVIYVTTFITINNALLSHKYLEGRHDYLECKYINMSILIINMSR